MNTREVKALLRNLEEQYGCQIKINKAFLKSSKDKIYIISKDFAKLDESKIRINNLGMYFCKQEKDGIRLSIEGSQLIKPKKNFIQLSDPENWMKGEDIETNENVSGYVIVKYNNDTLGCGKFKQGKVLNYVPKDRTIKSNITHL